MTPDSYTNQEFFLDVGDGHQLYVQDWGNQNAEKVIIFLHGGPGSATQNKHRDIFDGTQQRVIFYDQRGCGKSTPRGSLEDNNTPQLIEDIEKIATHLNIESFVLCGGSWGSTLALAYATVHPERVIAMVLRGILTGTRREINWLDKGQFRLFYPDVWEAYLNDTPDEFRANPSEYHFKRALSDDEKASKASAYTYQTLEGSLLSLDDRYYPEDFSTYDPSGIKIEIHYLQNSFFLSDNYILAHADALTMPIWIVQGRYDMVCPPMTAYQLYKKLPSAEIIWTTANHRAKHEDWNISRMILKRITEAS
jgi:proline iminopeptidase